MKAGLLSLACRAITRRPSLRLASQSKRAPPPDSVDAIFFRRHIYYSLGEYEYANNHMTSCLKQDPEHKKCMDMARLLKKISNLRKAADYATSAVGLEKTMRSR